MLLGAGTSLFKDQMAADIYFQYIWTALGVVFRIAHVCVTYGISVVLVQVGVCAEAGQLPDVWLIDPVSLTAIIVDDQGPAHMDVHGAPPDLPNSDEIDNGPNAFYEINGLLEMAKPVPWHHKVTVRLAAKAEDRLLHYHQHAPRKGHGPPPPILPQAEGSYAAFKTLGFSTQVQNCRHAYDVIEKSKPRRRRRGESD
ncbi:hypothetical protein C8T65DRAFT_587242 [Cerioporus squamosus]|nr:hypothetical protein C8T65DRAFT_587242 [Cerioporus squamosus]